MRGIKGVNCCFTDLRQQTLTWADVQTFTNRLRSGWFNDIYYWTLSFDTSLSDLYLDLRSQKYKKANTSEPVVSHSHQYIWIELGVLLRFVDQVNLIPISFRPINMQGRELYIAKQQGDRVLDGRVDGERWGRGGGGGGGRSLPFKRSESISFKIATMTRVTALYISISAFDFHSRSQWYKKNKFFCADFCIIWVA